MKFVPEGIVWETIAHHFKTRFVNEPLRIYFTKGTQGAPRLSLRDPKGHAVGQVLYRQQVLNNNLKWFFYAPWEFFWTALQYTRFLLFTEESLIKQLKKLHREGAILVGLLFPFGWLFYLSDRLYEIIH